MLARFSFQDGTTGQLKVFLKPLDLSFHTHESKEDVRRKNPFKPSYSRVFTIFAFLIWTCVTLPRLWLPCPYLWFGERSRGHKNDKYSRQQYYSKPVEYARNCFTYIPKPPVPPAASKSKCSKYLNLFFQPPPCPGWSAFIFKIRFIVGLLLLFLMHFSRFIILLLLNLRSESKTFASTTAPLRPTTATTQTPPTRTPTWNCCQVRAPSQPPSAATWSASAASRGWPAPFTSATTVGTFIVLNPWNGYFVHFRRERTIYNSFYFLTLPGPDCSPRV